ncbi:hypothetical protein HPB47_024253 [Ixodes persulcatus]|uniref:Uncharacterized protein n=1 Tax=Ixodes persulcatus TaxID=34615 RepID=A0AC60Q4S5_IXOPE|nr:hypothetical protein HPB47_024253 [Ixodes persulcatus]
MELLRLFLALLLLCFQRDLTTASPVSAWVPQTEPSVEHHDPTHVHGASEAQSGSLPDTHSPAPVSSGSQEHPQPHQADVHAAHEAPSKTGQATQTATHSSAPVLSGSQDQTAAQAQAASPDVQSTTATGTPNHQDPNRDDRTGGLDQRQGGYYPNRRPYRPYYPRPGYPRPGYPRPGYPRPGYPFRPGGYPYRPGGFPNRYPYRPLVRNYLFEQAPQAFASQANGILRGSNTSLGFVIDALLRLLSTILSPSGGGGGGSGGGSGGGGGSGNGTGGGDNLTLAQDGSLFLSVTNSSGPVKLLFALAEVPAGVQTFTDLRLNGDAPPSYYGLPPGATPWSPPPPHGEAPAGGVGVDTQPEQDPPKYDPDTAPHADPDHPATFQDHPPMGFY